MEENPNQTVERLAQEAHVIEVDGMRYSSSKLIPIIDDRNILSLDVKTLTGFVDYLRSTIDRSVVTPKLIIVHDETRVICVGELYEKTLKRDVIINALLPIEQQGLFPFGRFMDSEEFIIKLKSMFVNDPDDEDTDTAKLMKYVSSLSINNSIKVEDDGCSQTATIKRSMSGILKENVTAPSIVKLQPYRTFLEIDQPESSFLFRMKAIEGKVPVCALFEADGGAWKHTAMEAIAEYIDDKVIDIKVIH